MSKLLNKPIEYLLMLSIILECNSLYKYTVIGPLLKYIIIITTIILIVFNYKNNKIQIEVFYKVKNTILLIVFFSTIYIFFNFNLSYNLIMFFLIPIILFFTLNIIYIYNRNFSLLESYVNLIFLLSILSLFFWFFASLLNIIENTGYLNNLWAGENVLVRSYYGLYFETQHIVVFDNIIFRNSGIFTEGPMWNLLLSIALIFQIVFLNNNDRIKTLLLSITTLTTITTTGFIVLILLSVYVIWKKIGGGFISSLSFILITSYISIYLIENKTNVGSTTMRADDYKSGFLSWLDNIFVGNGYGNMDSIYTYMDLTIRNNLGYSNSFFLILSQGGILLFTILILPSFFIIVKSKIEYKFFAIMFLFLVLTAIYFGTFMFLFLVSMTYSLLILGYKIN